MRMAGCDAMRCACMRCACVRLSMAGETGLDVRAEVRLGAYKQGESPDALGLVTRTARPRHLDTPRAPPTWLRTVLGVLTPAHFRPPKTPTPRAPPTWLRTAGRRSASPSAPRSARRCARRRRAQRAATAVIARARAGRHWRARSRRPQTRRRRPPRRAGRSCAKSGQWRRRRLGANTSERQGGAAVAQARPRRGRCIARRSTGHVRVLHMRCALHVCGSHGAGCMVRKRHHQYEKRWALPQGTTPSTHGVGCCRRPLLTISRERTNERTHSGTAERICRAA